VIAESILLLGEELFFSIMREVFLELFGLLMGWHEKATALEASLQADLARVAIKNYIKIVKKCLSDKLAATPQLIELTLVQLHSFVSAHPQQLSIEYCLDLCTLLEFFAALANAEQPLCSRQHLPSIIGEMEKIGERFDKTSLIWRKKYEPALSQLKESLKAP
jgi:hypothetical protein